MSSWIQRFDATGPGLRLAVKDAIDVEGVPTTVGCAAIADTAAPATADAACVATARAAGAVIVGKTNLHELCFGTSGINPWFGTPRNPAAPDRVPGGSSSGSAVAVAEGEADVAYGTDTGGSVRIPAACCGVVGLKTTFGRVPTDGVWPLSPSLDTVGPLARDMAGVVSGMGLLEPGFTPAAGVDSGPIGRLRLEGTDEAQEVAIDDALAAAGLMTVDIHLPSWDSCNEAFVALLLAEAWAADRHLLDRAPTRIGERIVGALRMGQQVTPERLAAARSAQAAWKIELDEVLSRVGLIALPTLLGPPPLLDAADRFDLTRLTRPINLSGTPALSLPIPVAGWPMPGSLQLAAAAGGEEVLCAVGAAVESAVGPGLG